ncbi:hypothetical protein TIFTF001_039653 [Ficus carica]|uniref:Retrotransposon gag domain-containing protein n=1 Tax=Ficus carica TaxID=3494 RepID=A0AA88EAB5_FICCA|nr:hypothetical protein TIFTF001_039653 [Ficus carica]
MASPYPARFKMPSMASYDGSTDADEHLENYQVHMLIQNANEAALSAFLGSKTRKMETSYLFGIKQGDSEPLKEFLDRFDKTLAYDVPPTFAHLRGIDWKHAEADEYVRGRSMAAREQSRFPGRKSDKNQFDQNRPEKGKAVSIDARSAEAPSSVRTSAGRFRQYTPLVATVEHVLNQSPDYRRGWSGKNDPDGGVHRRGPAVCLQHHHGEADPQCAESGGLYIPLSHEIPHHRWSWGLSGEPVRGQKVLHGGGEQGVPQGS